MSSLVSDIAERSAMRLPCRKILDLVQQALLRL